MVGTDSSDHSSQESMSVGRQGPVEKTATVATTKSRSAKRVRKQGNKRAKKKKSTTGNKRQDIGSMSENNANDSGKDEDDKLSVNLLTSEEEDGVDGNDKSKEGRVPQTADKQKFKVIAWDEFKPDGAVTKGYILDLLGRKKARMTDIKLDKYFHKTKDLKKKVLDYMKTYISRKWSTVAENDVNLTNTLPLLQKQWGDLDLNNKDIVERPCKSFWKLVQPGACDKFDNDWEFQAQDKYMLQNGNKYGTEDDTQGNNKGCIAMTGNVALQACWKNFFPSNKLWAWIFFVTNIPRCKRNKEYNGHKEETQQVQTKLLSSIKE
jgi:hypothetical protein